MVECGLVAIVCVVEAEKGVGGGVNVEKTEKEGRCKWCRSWRGSIDEIASRLVECWERKILEQYKYDTSFSLNRKYS